MKVHSYRDGKIGGRSGNGSKHEFLKFGPNWFGSEEVWLRHEFSMFTNSFRLISVLLENFLSP